MHYRQVDLLPDYGFDYPAIEQALRGGVKLVTIQRSKGYATRPTFSVQQIGELIAFCKRIDPNVICMVDNCYGEFVETIEPSDLGADMIVGSLIKNPGGGLAPIGGYICGRQDLVDRCAFRLSAPGLGQEVGAEPRAHAGVLSGLLPRADRDGRRAQGRAVFAANVYERLGFRCIPNAAEPRTTSSSAWSLARRSAWSPSARAFRRPRPWTAMSTPSPGPCRATTRRSSWPPARSCRARPLNSRPTGRSARPTPCIFRAA